MSKKTILIIIDSLGRGGAETLVIGQLPELTKRYRIVLVTLNNICQFEKELVTCDAYYCLNIKNKINYITKIRKLAKIIKIHHPDLIHTHLFYSTILGRIAKPKNIPLIFSIHNQFSLNNGKLEKFLERVTYKKSQSLLGVSHTIVKDYKKIFKKNIRTFVLHNYVSDIFFSNHQYRKSDYNPLRLVAVGNVKKQKNYEYIIEAFNLLIGVPASIDIYGKNVSTLGQSLIKQVHENKLPINFMGVTTSIESLLPQYDLYISSSSYEGFGISVVEAMASGLPTLLSDIPVYREITDNNALFFSLDTPRSLADLIKKIIEKKIDLDELSRKGKEIAKNYRYNVYIVGLFKIYDDLMTN